MMCVKVIDEPSGSVEVLRMVTKGGAATDVSPLMESVTVTETGRENVDSGTSVIVRVIMCRTAEVVEDAWPTWRQSV